MTENIIEDPIFNVLGKICVVCLKDRREFAARLIEIRDNNELWMQSKNGLKWMVRRENLLFIRPVRGEVV